MTWYRTGTAAFTNGNATVTGTGTAWIANASIGEGLIAPDGRIYEIIAIASDTSLTISPAYLGSTASGQAYAVAPIRGRIAQLLSETSSLLSSFATVRDGIGAGLFPNGTVSAPALRAAADQDTGLFFPSANTLAVATGGAERVRIASNGNVGIGTSSPSLRLQVAGRGGMGSDGIFYWGQELSGSNRGFLSWASNVASVHAVGSLVFATNSGTERMRITSTGNVGIGTSSPDAVKLHVVEGVKAGVAVTTGDVARFECSNGSRAFVSIIGRALGQSELHFGDEVSSNAGRVRYDHTNDSMNIWSTGATVFRNATIDRLVITSAGLVRPGADNTQSFGEASFRWAQIFAGSGTINTSDEREKVWRGELDEAELRAAKRIIGELGMYQWADSYEEKGEDARLHFGVRAQRAFGILEEEGLDWWRYAWCCHDKWDEITEPVFEEVTVEKTRTVELPEEREVEKTETVMEPVIDEETGEQVFDEDEQPVMVEVERTFTVTETVMVEVEETYEEVEQRDTGEVRIVREAGDRYGIRPDQLAFWLIAAQAEIQNDLDARLAKLEAAQ